MTKPEFEVAIIGAGATGAALGTVLARQGLKTAVIDPRAPHERDFRAEKLTEAQWERVRQLDLQEVLNPVVTPEPRMMVARRGRVIETLPSGNRNYRYPVLVEALRNAARNEAALEFIPERVAGLEASEGDQQISLGDGRTLTARLAVVATGVGDALSRNMGFRRRVIFAEHSVSVGFDMAPVGREKFDFPALAYFGERAADQIAYLSLFRIGAVMRANFFVYRASTDPCFAALQSSPDEALAQLLPGLAGVIGGFAVQNPVSLRPVDLFRMENVVRPGVVLIGDAFGTACPASGAGMDKVFSDVARLNAHLPVWLATPGMAAEKIAAFYADPQKIAVDADTLSRARFLREICTNETLRWRWRRNLRFITQLARGKLRALLPVAPQPKTAANAPQEA